MKRSAALLFINIISTIAVAQKPEARWLHQMVYDDANNEVLVYGGATPDKICTDLWSLHGSTLKKLSDDGPPIIKCAFAWDANRKRAVLFGGSGSERSLDETWEWDGNKWQQIRILSPTARNHPMAVYDANSKLILMFGGYGANGALSDTWSYDGISWKQVDTIGPRNCLPHGMIYDETRQSVILITVALSAPNETHAKNEMWEWTGNSWKKLSYNAPLTSLNSLQALAAFAEGQIVLFDGDDVSNGHGKTWKFSKDRWTSESLPGPSARVGHGMVYDKSRKRTILFGGSDRKQAFDDLWEWNGHEWLQIR